MAKTPIVLVQSGSVNSAGVQFHVPGGHVPGSEV